MPWDPQRYRGQSNMDESLGSGTCQPVVGMRASVNHASFSHTVILRNPLSRAVFPCSGRVFHPLDREKTLFEKSYGTEMLTLLNQRLTFVMRDYLTAEQERPRARRPLVLPHAAICVCR